RRLALRDHAGGGGLGLLRVLRERGEVRAAHEQARVRTRRHRWRRYRRGRRGGTECENEREDSTETHKDPWSCTQARDCSPANRRQSVRTLLDSFFSYERNSRASVLRPAGAIAVVRHDRDRPERTAVRGRRRGDTRTLTLSDAQNEYVFTEAK